MWQKLLFKCVMYRIPAWLYKMKSSKDLKDAPSDSMDIFTWCPHEREHNGPDLHCSVPAYLSPQITSLLPTNPWLSATTEIHSRRTTRYGNTPMPGLVFGSSLTSPGTKETFSRSGRVREELRMLHNDTLTIDAKTSCAGPDPGQHRPVLLWSLLTRKPSQPRNPHLPIQPT